MDASGSLTSWSMRLAGVVLQLAGVFSLLGSCLFLNRSTAEKFASDVLVDVRHV